MRSKRNRTGAEVCVAVAIVAITLATWVAAGVFSASPLLRALDPGDRVQYASGQVVLVSPARILEDPRDMASSRFVEPGVIAALTAPADRPAQVRAPRPAAAPVAAPLPLGEATIDPTAGGVTASTPATPVSAPLGVSIDAGPVLAPVTNTVGGLVDIVGGSAGGLLGRRR